MCETPWETLGVRLVLGIVRGVQMVPGTPPKSLRDTQSEHHSSHPPHPVSTRQHTDTRLALGTQQKKHIVTEHTGTLYIHSGRYRVSIRKYTLCSGAPHHHPLETPQVEDGGKGTTINRE